MDTSLNNTILAIVVRNDKKAKVAGGAYVFTVDTDQEMEEISMLLARTTMSMAHQLADGIRIIVKH